ncbi:hypothetical protein ABU162_19965 [Paenibacillus thiaminolyticus]|uniref:hypothetical protein n=1 Tax=Paenibacillus thiaminolyticus TaxID=49283 RepID=UPI0035A57D4B
MKKKCRLTVVLLLVALLITTACASQEGILPQSSEQVEANAPLQPQPVPADPRRTAESIIYEIDLSNYSEIPEIPFGWRD